MKLEASARQLIERGAGAPVERQKSASLARCRRRHLGPLDDNDVDPAASEDVRDAGSIKCASHDWMPKRIKEKSPTSLRLPHSVA
ncbi:hypothetical protein ABIC10_001714 [Bradyrhizobium sp. S3.2.12]